MKASELAQFFGAIGNRIIRDGELLLVQSQTVPVQESAGSSFRESFSGGNSAGHDQGSGVCAALSYDPR